MDIPATNEASVIYAMPDAEDSIEKREPLLVIQESSPFFQNVEIMTSHWDRSLLNVK